MWNPFRLAREAAAADRATLLAALATQHEQSLAALQQIGNLAGKMADASKAQADSFTAYLSLFQTQAAPESRVMRDEDEYKEQLRRDGFPVDLSEEDQLNWVLERSSH